MVARYSQITTGTYSVLTYSKIEEQQIKVEGHYLQNVDPTFLSKSVMNMLTTGLKMKYKLAYIHVHVGILIHFPLESHVACPPLFV